MSAHRWTKAMRARASQSQKTRYAMKKAVKEIAALTPKGVQEAMNKLQPQEAAVDVREMERFNYRRGLLDAAEMILRELRHA